MIIVHCYSAFQRGLKNAKRKFSVQHCTTVEESLLQSFYVYKLSATML